MGHLTMHVAARVMPEGDEEASIGLPRSGEYDSQARTFEKIDGWEGMEPHTPGH